ncbi:hypothetical protein Leryth_002586 [Lithospermum erythrorhizon]|nr:hypothetical protein Leryth_002586 [Lithospermum erythrorhizon]
MLKGSKPSVLSLAERCRNILASNWHGKLSTIKADAHGSKEEIYSSKVKYFVKKGRVYIWVSENDQHDVNAIIDERGSFAVNSPHPGSLATILRSVGKFPTRVALTGEVIRVSDEKIKLVAETLRETLSAEQKAIKESGNVVSGILNSSNLDSSSRSKNLQELLDSNKSYIPYKFNMRQVDFISFYHVQVFRHEPLEIFVVLYCLHDYEVHSYHVILHYVC